MLSRGLRVAGAVEFSTEAVGDRRGLSVSTYQEDVFTAAVGRPLFPVAQSTTTRSRKGVVRGIHFQPHTAKYAYCLRGKSLDIVLDTRVGSPTFGRWDSVMLDDRHFRALYLPAGVGHLSVALAGETTLTLLTSTPYDDDRAAALCPVDAGLDLPLPRGLTLTITDRDQAAPTLAEALAADLLPEYASQLDLKLC
ncbi:dTDP-4-dehydrorhamnose 3,5-epimerase family protein [Actinokineospora globicatena]|uniref:dTDP-4-dehydrorhamnose 3,5-epimerase family protein n=1 Tax=Actinokineospora globicatena TaxID=103729 RepID=UPI0020A49F4A|nr:dTDP-4-dehydrorhamnose 3,5-epimerase family protein [Actinokineospora globicatena]MCP2304531.1 epimerase EvaD [Actinokineospora globicatena]GLW78100.1 dTDP-4-dehydrorhamnose 3,5-epimerase [Actinokineospora globicatena]GLW85234.1 dTDP-4-dehydrorhamnose 3,5-epimerase [Actinokineospora globicatena]